MHMSHVYLILAKKIFNALVVDGGGASNITTPIPLDLCKYEKSNQGSDEYENTADGPDVATTGFHATRLVIPGRRRSLYDRNRFDRSAPSMTSPGWKKTWGRNRIILWTIGTLSSFVKVPSNNCIQFFLKSGMILLLACNAALRTTNTITPCNKSDFFS
jgi:hypothetical protein